MVKTDTTTGSDAVRMALSLWKSAKADPIDFLKTSDHYKRLIDNGVEDDAAFCFVENTSTVVPYYDKTRERLRIFEDI